MTSSYQFDLTGLRVFLTGGAQGMGKGIAKSFAAWGANVGVTDIDQDGATATARAIVESGGQAMSYAVDVVDEKSVQQAVNAYVAHAGGVDLAIHAAAVLSVGQVLDLMVDEWRRVLDVNATGTFIVARTAARAMMQEGTSGSIVCISSIGGKRGSPGLAHYNASKFAVVGFVQAFAREMGHNGIRVNAICPGTVLTQMIDDLAIGWKMTPEEMLDMQVLKRAQTPAEIAMGVASLHVNEAITGQSLNVDGGSLFH